MACGKSKMTGGRATRLAGPLTRRSLTTSGRFSVVPRPCLSLPPSPSWRISSPFAIGYGTQQPQQLVQLVFLPSPRTRPGPRLERSIPEPVMLQDYDFLCRMSFEICFACGGHMCAITVDGAAGFETQAC